MDDRQFDHIVKNKLESISPAYNEQAWKALDYRLDLLTPLPWYSRWKGLLVASSLGIITLLNIGLLYKVDREQDQLEQLVTLLTESNKNSATDTIYLVGDTYLGKSFLDNGTGDRLLASTNEAAVYDLFDPLSVYKITATASASERASVTGFPQSELNSVVLESVAALEPATASYKASSVIAVNPIDPFSQTYQFDGLNGDDMFVRGVVLPPKKKKWDYPIQPRIGITAGYLIPDPDLGERFVTSRQSLLIESPIRKSLHLMSGLSYQEIPYKLDDVDDVDNFERITLLNYPGFGSFSTSPDEISVENKMLQLPIYLRYYKPLNRNWSVFVGGGPTIDILLSQKFTYSFLEIQNEQLVKFDETVKSNDVQVSLGSISGHAGIEHYFNHRLSAQVELNYQYGLGKIGLEGRSFNSFSVGGGLFYKLNKRR